MEIYSYSKKAVVEQYLFSVALVVAAILVGHFLLGVIAVMIALLFVKDGLRLQNETVEINEEGLKIYKKDQVVKSLLWQDMTYIVVKGRKWLVMSDGEKKYTLTHQLEDLHIVAKKIIDFNRKNKKLFVDPTMNDVFHVGVKLNEHNNIVK